MVVKGTVFSLTLFSCEGIHKLTKDSTGTVSTPCKGSQSSGGLMMVVKAGQDSS